MFWSPLWVTLLLRVCRTSGHWREAWRQGEAATVLRSYGHGDLPIVRYCKILFRIPRPQFLLGQIVNTNMSSAFHNSWFQVRNHDIGCTLVAVMVVSWGFQPQFGQLKDHNLGGTMVPSLQASICPWIRRILASW